MHEACLRTLSGGKRKLWLRARPRSRNSRWNPRRLASVTMRVKLEPSRRTAKASSSQATSPVPLVATSILTTDGQELRHECKGITARLGELPGAQRGPQEPTHGAVLEAARASQEHDGDGEPSREFESFAQLTRQPARTGKVEASATDPVFILEYFHRWRSQQGCWHPPRKLLESGFPHGLVQFLCPGPPFGSYDAPFSRRGG